MGLGESAGLEAAKLYKPIVDKLSNQTDNALVQLKHFEETIDKRGSEFIDQLNKLTQIADKHFNDSIYQVDVIRKSTEKRVEMILSELNQTREFLNDMNDNLFERLKLAFFVLGCSIQLLIIVTYVMFVVSKNPNRKQRDNKRDVFEEIVETIQLNVTVSYIMFIIILMVNIILYSICYSVEVFSLISVSSTMCFGVFSSFQISVDVFSRRFGGRIPLLSLISAFSTALILNSYLIMVYYKLSFLTPYISRDALNLFVKEL